jgi:2-polyprenyl-3-methyl-5-hydroxy-6-metoxy-1,4-benzoquinol methylase
MIQNNIRELENNFERAVFLKGEPVLPREATRYIWANEHLLGKNILEVGCSSGYGIQFLPNDIQYIGVDYDLRIIQCAAMQGWRNNTLYVHADINTLQLQKHDTIIAFEVIEHLDNGLEIVEKLKKHCKRLLLTVPHNEPKGFWGEHHKLHGLTQADFPDFEFEYVNEHGQITKELQLITEQNICNLMLCKYSAQ